MPAAKQIRVDDGAPSSIVLQAVSLLLREGVEWTSLTVISPDYHKPHGQDKSSGKASGRGDEERLDLDALMEKNLLWAEAGDGTDITKRRL